MKIVGKMIARRNDPYNCPIPVIVFFGDSVTQGCFEIFETNGDDIGVVYDPVNAYHAQFSRMLAHLIPNAPVSIVNAGISGDSTEGALARIDRDVLAHNPDLTVVCFGLNDSVGDGRDGADSYADRLETIFRKLVESGSEVIYLTPNMMCTEVSSKLKHTPFMNLASEIARIQNDGVLTLYLEKGKQMARACGVRICDVYAKWLRLSEMGVDTTALLSNSINHPTREMNQLFAWSLLETIFAGE